jgi:hypothetical protein
MGSSLERQQQDARRFGEVGVAGADAGFAEEDEFERVDLRGVQRGDIIGACGPACECLA